MDTRTGPHFITGDTPAAPTAPILPETLKNMLDKIRQSVSREELHGALLEATQNLGYHFYSMAQIRNGSIARDGVLLTNYPENWLKIIGKMHNITDPIIMTASQTMISFEWTEIRHMTDVSQEDLDYMSIAATHRLRNGITIPIPEGHPTRTGMVCMAPDNRIELPRQNHQLAHIVAVTAYNRALAILEHQEESNRISRRQIECIQLVAEGKTTREIAKILGISPHSVRNHLKRSMDILKVTRQPQLVAIAIRRNLIQI